MTNKLQTHGAISKERLSSESWFLSFLSEATRQRLLSDGQLRAIQEEMVQLMVFLATRYTAGASTSVREETAQSLMACAVYSIGHTLKKMPIDAALHELQNVPIKALFDRGQRELRELLASAKAQYATLLKNGMPLGSVTWQSTMHTGLAEFFAAYNVYDAAHESSGLIDYPTALPLEGVGGIEYISRYLKRLALEDSFVRRWPSGEVDGLIRAGGAVDAPVNVFTLVLTNALGAVLCGRRPDTLSLSSEDRSLLSEKLTNGALRRVLRSTADTLCQYMSIRDDARRRYVSDTAVLLAPVIKNALATNTLPRVFLTLKAAPNRTFFHDAPRMDDKQFRALAEEIIECGDPGWRAELVKMNVFSVADLADLFEAGCLSGADIRNVLNSLDDEPLAMLLCISREYAPDALHTSEAEHTWRRALNEHLSALAAEKQRRIKDMARHIEFV